MRTLVTSMHRWTWLLCWGILLGYGATAATWAAEPLKPGKVTLKSAGPITFGPEDVLFIGDPKAATIYAVRTGEKEPAPAVPIQIEQLDTALAGLLGVPSADVQINDIAVSPITNRVYLSVSRGKGADAIPVIVIAGPQGKLSLFSLESEVPHAKVELSKPVTDAKRRSESITSMKYLKGTLYVSGLSNEEFASTLRAIPYPFAGQGAAAGIQIFHGAHGKFETASPVRTFATVEINGKDEILAAYTCTPLVRIPVEQLKDGAKVKGTTVAELGNRNRPLDIVPYTKGGKAYALMANSARGVMKVSLENIDKVEAIVTKINGTAGLKYDTLAELKGVEQLAKLGEAHVVMLVRGDKGLALQTIELP